MPRIVSSELQNLLAKPVIWTQTTLDLAPPSMSPIYIATAAFTVDGKNYIPHIISSGEIQMTIAAGTNMVRMELQNADLQWGFAAESESLANIPATVGRAFKDYIGGNIIWQPLFAGIANAVEFDEEKVVLEIVNDLTAAGYVVAQWSLSDHCQYKFKQPDTCGYNGSLESCNLRRLSLDGCLGRNNEHHFGGMEFPDPQIPEPPTGGIDFPGGGGPPSCPRDDQWVLVDNDGVILPQRANTLKRGDKLWDPRRDESNEIESVSICDAEIWAVETYGGSLIFSSGSHPLIQSMADHRGRPVRGMNRGDYVMVYKQDGLWIEPLRSVRNTGKIGRVVKIELIGGHIYAAGHNGMILSHNSKPIEDQF